MTAKDSTTQPHRTRVLRPSETPLRIDALFGPRDTPGNVGVCLSGGSSRAMCAAMGQLRGLAALRENGKSLLSQVKALSTVSGGSWCGVPFIFLRGDVSDTQYLGAYVADPARLVPLPLPEHGAEEVLTRLGDGCIGQVAADPSFSAAGLAMSVLQLRLDNEVPPEQLWTRLVGERVLAPYGLFDADADAALFSRDETTLHTDVLDDNPHLAGTPVHLYADASAARQAHASTVSQTPLDDNALSESDEAHGPRPFLICNTAMFLRQPGETVRPLVPVQVTPRYAGIVAAPEGVDANGWRVGDCLAAPFALDAELCALRADRAEITQSRPFTLNDAIAASSAFYAEMLQNLFITMRNDPAERERLLAMGLAAVSEKVRGPLASLQTSLRQPDVAALGNDLSRLDETINELCEIIPKHRYWSARDPHPAESSTPTRFADGGSLENTGLAGLLAYTDIDRAIAFVNSRTPLSATDHGVRGKDDRELADTAIMIDPQLPPLFGYQPYREGIGYIPYAGDDTPEHPNYARSQLFERDAFPALLRALWHTSGNASEPGCHRHAAIAELTLRVLPNPWFGIAGRGGEGDTDRRPIELVLVYTTRVRRWFEQLSPPMQRIHGTFDDPTSCNAFPHYSTAHTQLPPLLVNLLAHLTSWTVAADENAETFRRLFRADG